MDNILKCSNAISNTQKIIKHKTKQHELTIILFLHFFCLFLWEFTLPYSIDIRLEHWLTHSNKMWVKMVNVTFVLFKNHLMFQPSHFFYHDTSDVLCIICSFTVFLELTFIIRKIGFWEKDQQSKEPFLPYIKHLYYQHVWSLMMVTGWDRFLYFIITLPPQLAWTPFISLEGSHYVNPTLKGWERKLHIISLNSSA